MAGDRRPIGGRDYPRTYQEFRSWFPDEWTCREYLAGLRWPHGFSCPDCGSGGYWRTGAGLWMCTDCGLKSSATAGTIFHRSHTPLATWFAAIWFVTSQKNGVSARGLQDVLGFGSYETAWAWLHKLRRAMVRPERELLSGVVELDQSFLGGRSHGRPGAASGKAPITIAVERLASGRLGRVRLDLAKVPNGVDQVEFAREVIAPGTEIHTDGALVLTRLTNHGFTHHATRGYLADDLDAVMPGPHLVSSLLKRWTAGTLHHRISRQHLPYYLDEFTFRFNRRTSRARGLLFYRLLQQAAGTDPHPSPSSSAAPATTGTSPQTTERQLHSSGYAGCMFDSTGELLAVPTARLASLIEQNHAELLSAECRMLQLACAWADAHYLDSGNEEYQPLIKRACAWGGEGTPEVSEYCAAELGALQGTGMMAARALIADALDLRYRLPRLWDRVLTGGVRAWQARKIAEQTRVLSWEACADVDHALSDFVGMMPWPRFAKILSAAVLEADPGLAAERAERARTTQDVFSFDSEDGLKTVVARAAAGDAIWFLATVNRIAEILAARGDTDPVGMRRARAIGILAQPAEALRLLIEHQHDPTGQPDESTKPAESTEPGEPNATFEDVPDDESDITSQDEPDATSEEEQDAGSEEEPDTGSEEAASEDGPGSDSETDDHQSLSMVVPAAFDARAARPRVVLHFHLSEAALRSGDAMVRPEDGDPLSFAELVEFLGRRGCQVRIQPVLDPTEVAPVDGYEVPQRLRAAVRVRQIADVFPFGTCVSPSMDLDHTERYVPTDYGGPPGQTRLGNLGPMARPGHRAVTHGGWRKHQPVPGYFVHRSPNGYVYLVSNQGTLALGRTAFSAAVWDVAAPKPAAIPPS